MTDLLPCPFCGNPAPGTASSIDATDWGVLCGKCGASCSTTCETETHAISSWNARHGAAQLPDAATSAELGRWCSENPNLAAQTIIGLRAALAPGNAVADPTERPSAANRASKGADAMTVEATVASAPTQSSGNAGAVEAVLPCDVMITANAFMRDTITHLKGGKLSVLIRDLESFGMSAAPLPATQGDGE